MSAILLLMTGLQVAGPDYPLLPIPVTREPRQIAVRIPGGVWPVERSVVYEHEWTRYSVLLTRSGGGLWGEWYLGNGWAVGVGLELAASPDRAGFRLAVPVVAEWYPVEGVGFVGGLDLWGRQVVSSLTLDLDGFLFPTKWVSRLLTSPPGHP